MSSDRERADRIQELARNIRERRRALKLTQEGLADLAQCSPRFLRNLEAGRPGIRLDKYLDVIQALGLVVTLVPRRGPR
jgi:transcriptional regulator with XRE-family HTH domain